MARPTQMWAKAARVVATWHCPRCFAPRGAQCVDLRIGAGTERRLPMHHRERGT